jgi:hypothetical protein
VKQICSNESLVILPRSYPSETLLTFRIQAQNMNNITVADAVPTVNVNASISGGIGTLAQQR